MKGPKMKENPQHDKERSFCLKHWQLSIPRQSIEIGLNDLLYSGPNVENSTYKFKLPSKIFNDGCVPESLISLLLTTSVKTLSAVIYLPRFYRELIDNRWFGCFAWSLVGMFQLSLSSYRSRDSQVLRKHLWGVYALESEGSFKSLSWAEPVGPCFWQMLAVPSTVENNEISTIAQLLWSDLHSRLMKDLSTQGGQEGNSRTRNFWNTKLASEVAVLKRPSRFYFENSVNMDS